MCDIFEIPFFCFNFFDFFRVFVCGLTFFYICVNLVMEVKKYFDVKFEREKAYEFVA